MSLTSLLSDREALHTLVLPTSLNFSAVLPQTEGYLPKWQLFVAATALFNTVQNFTSLKLTKRLYGGSPLGAS